MKKSNTKSIAEEYNGRVLPSTKCGNFIVRNYVNCKHVIEVAERYKDVLHVSVYNNLINKTVEIIKHENSL